MSSAKILHIEVRLFGKLLFILKVRVDPTPDPWGTLNKVPSNLKFDHLKLAFALGFLGSFLVEKIIHLQHHTTLIWVKDHTIVSNSYYVSFPDRVTQWETLNFEFSDHQLIYYTRKITRIESYS